MKRNHFLIILILVLFYAINNYFWLLENKLPVSYDEGVHLWTNLRFLRAFIHPTHNIFYELFHAGDITHWPPLFYFTASLFNLIFGSSYIVSVMTNMLFFLVLLVSLYLIGRKIHSSSVGILAAIIVSFYPVIYGQSRLFLLDFALTAIVTLSIYCLIKADRFRNLYWSVIFGISAGLGMLIKWSYIFFILPLFVYEVIRYLCDIKKKDFLYRIKNLTVTIIVSFLISSIWYAVHIEKNKGILQYLKRAMENRFYHPLEEMEWLTLSFNNNMLSFLFFLLFIISIIAFYLKINSKFKLFITTWYLVPLLVISFVRWKQARFFMPILPCFALISAMGIINFIKNKKIKNTTIALIFIIGLMQYYSSSFKDRKIGVFYPEWKNIDAFYKPYLEGTIAKYSVIASAPPYKTNWRHADIAKSFVRYIKKVKNYPFVIGVIYTEDDLEGLGLNNLFANRIMNYYLFKELIESDVTFLKEMALTLELSEIKRFAEFMPEMQGILYISRNNIWPEVNDVEIFLKNHLDILTKLESNPVNHLRLIELIKSKEKFILIDRIALQNGYYANLYFYNIPEIKKDDLLVKIFNGKMKIFYKDKEITKDIGLTSGLVYNNKAYSYNEAIWNFYNISPYEAKIVSEYPDLEIKQTVLINMNLAEKNTLHISVNLESQSEITLYCWYMNSLLSNDYKEWVRPFSRGIFEEIPLFSDSNGFEDLDSVYEGPNVIGMLGNAHNGLPSILFKCSNVDVPLGIGPTNINYYRYARCIYTRTNSVVHLEPEKTKKVLDMDIRILDNSELENIVSDIRKKFSVYEKQ